MPILFIALLILTIGVPLYFFDHISGPHTLNCFANSNNHKLPRFYSRYWNPEVEGVDAFCHDWRIGGITSQCPGYFLFPGLLDTLRSGKGTLIVPECFSSLLWPMFSRYWYTYSNWVRIKMYSQRNKHCSIKQFHEKSM